MSSLALTVTRMPPGRGIVGLNVIREKSGPWNSVMLDGITSSRPRRGLIVVSARFSPVQRLEGSTGSLNTIEISVVGSAPAGLGVASISRMNGLPGNTSVKELLEMFGGNAASTTVRKTA